MSGATHERVDRSGRPSPKDATLRVLVLVALVAAVFRVELWWMIRMARHEPEAATVLAAPVLVALLWWLRRGVLARSVAPGSPWGLAVMLAAVLALAAATWASFALPGRLAWIVATGGAVLAAAGWRVLWHALPILLVLLASIPLGPRTYAAVSRAPELLTLQTARPMLELLPGVDLVTLRGPDLAFLADGVRGTIALGEPHRGAALLAASCVVVLFVACARVRPAWQLVALAILAVPILAACNLARIIAWGAATVYADASPTSPWPRLAAAAVSVLGAWALAGTASWVLDRLVVSEPRGQAA